MMDQKAKFSPRGLKTEFIGEAQLDRDVVRRVLTGDVQLVFISPESIISNPSYRNMLLSSKYKNNLIALVVDEAHCVKTWGDEFRTAFANIGDLRSLLPTSVKVMALTATATQETLRVVSERLSMRNVAIVSLPPGAANITYSIQPLQHLDEFTDAICEEIGKERVRYPKTVIFCQKYRDCSDLYTSLHRKLGPGFTEPPSYPNFHQFRLVDLYTRVATVSMKEKILASFMQPSGILRLVIATTAFGMGIDCKDIHRVIHWGTPTDIEQYVQATGRAGRDGLQSQAILHDGKISRYVQQSMRDYLENRTQCRRKLLFCRFLAYSETEV